MKITPTSLTINQLLGSVNEQYVIPTYQRRYSWHERQVWELIDDIELVEGNDTHLLGSIVCLAGHHTAGLNQLELVDGQQRLTTLAIVLECARQHLEGAGRAEAAAEIARLLVAKPLDGKTIRKVALESIDASEFDRLVQGDRQHAYLNQDLARTFAIVRDWIANQTPERLARFLYRLTNQAIVIRLDVSDAKDAFKLFETINNRGLRLSPTDIIKNFLLGNAARFGDESLQSARKTWAALIGHLDATSTDAFFRYYLMALLQVRVTASEVVPEFKKFFMRHVREASTLPERHVYADPDEAEDEDSEDVAPPGSAESEAPITLSVSFNEFLNRLAQSAKIYSELVLVKTGDAALNRHLRNLKMIKAVQTYGFLMNLRVRGCSDKNFREVLKLTEGFILRRHVCRERSNETEALFARLCGVDPADPVKPTRIAYKPLCPDDEKFRVEFANAVFSANLVDRARYCLEQFELHKHGRHEEIQVLGAEDVHVEHIIPQKIKTKKAKEEFGDWVSYLGSKAEAEHPKYVSRIGNLTIFAGELNIGASNNPFASKKKAYKQSAIEITKELVGYANFRFKEVERRSGDLAKLALELWPQP